MTSNEVRTHLPLLLPLLRASVDVLRDSLRIVEFPPNDLNNLVGNKLFDQSVSRSVTSFL